MRLSLVVCMLLAAGSANAHQPVMDMAPRWAEGYGFQLRQEHFGSDDLMRGSDSVENAFKPPPNATAVQAMQHRLQTQEGKAVYAKRKAPVETVFGIVKEVLGFRQFLLRGLDSVQAEWSLVCIGWNLKRMHALSP